MSMEFTGKEVADAIRAACEHFQVARENLSIEVLETGSAGIFGLIRKKARVRAGLRRGRPDNDAPKKAALSTPAEPQSPGPQYAEQFRTEPHSAEQRPSESESRPDPGEEAADAAPLNEYQTVSPESQAVVRDILNDMLGLMEMPSTVEISANGLVVTCAITGPFEQELVGQDGRVIDSLQYFLRKIAARRCPEPLRIAVNVGDFRERRLHQLRAMAAQLVDEVRQSGKTGIIPALNPAERREIHLLLQNDPEIRSRSVGDGLFKRILIFKPKRPSEKTRVPPALATNRRPAKRKKPANGS